MQTFLEAFVSLVAYVVGLILIVKVTSRLRVCAYDDPWFMVFAVLEILGALLILGAVVVLLAIFNANIGIRSLDFILLVVVILISGRMAFSCLRKSKQDVQPISRYGAGIFCL